MLGGGCRGRTLHSPGWDETLPLVRDSWKLSTRTTHGSKTYRNSAASMPNTTWDCGDQRPSGVRRLSSAKRSAIRYNLHNHPDLSVQDLYGTPSSAVFVGKGCSSPVARVPTPKKLVKVQHEVL